MNALEMAQENMNRLEGGEFVDAMLVLGKVQAYAAIAQAEAQHRIAVALERSLSIQGVMPEFFEAVDRAKQLNAENLQLYQRIAELEGERDNDDDREAIQPGDYRYFTGRQSIDPEHNHPTEDSYYIS